jgi:hypothetical protein
MCLFLMLIGIGSAGEGTLYRNKEYAFRMIFPDGFTLKEGLMPNIKAKAVTGNGESVAVLAKTLLPDYSNVNFDRLTDKEILDFIEDVYELFKKTFMDARLVQKKVTYLSNHKAAMFTVTYTAKSIAGSAKTKQIIVETWLDGKLYNVSCGAPVETFDRYRPTFVKAIASFWLEDKSWYKK